MDRRALIITAFVALLITIAGSVLFSFGMKKENDLSATPATGLVQDTSGDNEAAWKTYQNEEYGFEFRYPEDWILEEFVTAGIGLPVDCKQTPLHKYCKNFGVVVMENSNQAARRYVALEVSNRSSEKTPQTIKKEEVESEDTSTTWEKSVGVQAIVKNSSYFPIFVSCWVTANPIPYLPIKKGEGYHFYTLYELSGDLYEDEAEEYCSKEVPDETFDKIVGSFVVLP